MESLGSQTISLTEAIQNLEITTSESQTIDSPDTLRLVSLRRIEKVYQKGEGWWEATYAEVDGWVCNVGPGTFKEGQLVIYVEIDAFLPATDDRFGNPVPVTRIGGHSGYRVRTQTSWYEDGDVVIQGYVFQIESFDEVHAKVQAARSQLHQSAAHLESTDSEVDVALMSTFKTENWADMLGIKKWEEQRVEPRPWSPNGRMDLGKFPCSLFPKTDLTRVQNFTALFSKKGFQSREYQESVKMDGASMTVYFVNNSLPLISSLNPLPEDIVGPNTVHPNGRFGVCSRNIELDELKPEAYGYWATANRYRLAEKLSKFGQSIAIHGELCGYKINKNREKIPYGQKDFFVFSMYDIAEQRYVDPRRVVFLAQYLGLRHVPVLGYVKIPDIASNIKDMKERAAKREGEGLVYKCVENGKSFKVVSNAYLLKHGI